MTIRSRAARLLPAVLVLVLTSCGGSQGEAEAPVRPVRYQQVFTTGGERTRTFSGVSRAGIESRLSFRVAGSVSAVAVKVGDRVRKGQTIARLDPRDYEVKVQEAEASVRKAEADARKANADYERVRALYENQNASRNDLDAARTGAETAAAALQAGRQRLELTRLQLSYTRLSAPVDGAIATIDVEVNENVSPGQTVAMLTAGSELEVEVAIPEMLIARIERNDPVQVSFDALPGRSFPAVVTEVGVASTGLATTFPVIVRLTESPSDVRSGMAAEVAFRLAATGERDRIVVPASAVAEDTEGRYAYVVEPTDPGFGTARRRTVSIGDLTGDGIEVLEGLADGDFVVTAGVSRIHDGQKVKLPEAATP